MLRFLLYGQNHMLKNTVKERERGVRSCLHLLQISHLNLMQKHLCEKIVYNDFVHDMCDFMKEIILGVIFYVFFIILLC